jgi:hypothetical protein
MTISTQSATKPTRRSVLGAGALAAALTLGVVGAPADAQAQDAQDYLLATASTGGTYYPVGVALSTLIKVRLQPSMGINVSAINSAGSGENIALLRDNEVQFAIFRACSAPMPPRHRSAGRCWSAGKPALDHHALAERRAFRDRSDLVDTGTVPTSKPPPVNPCPGPPELRHHRVQPHHSCRSGH